ncbi:MAG: hypothetical protein ABSF50_14490 [Burkholderiaceae bacterium]|jgi:hypothetical protein
MSFVSFRVFAAACLLLVTLSAGALPRVFPQNSSQVELQAVSDPYLTVDGEVVQMAQGILIFGPTNSTLVRGALQPGIWIRLQFDPQCMVRRIWILNDDEVVSVPIWESLFSSGFVPPVCSGQ